MGYKLECEKKLVANFTEQTSNSVSIRGLVSIYSSCGYDYTRSVLYWTCISMSSVIQNQLLVRTPFAGNNCGQDTQIT